MLHKVIDNMHDQLFVHCNSRAKKSPVYFCFFPQAKKTLSLGQVFKPLRCPSFCCQGFSKGLLAIEDERHSATPSHVTPTALKDSRGYHVKVVAYENIVRILRNKFVKPNVPVHCNGDTCWVLLRKVS